MKLSLLKPSLLLSVGLALGAFGAQALAADKASAQANGPVEGEDYVVASPQPSSVKAGEPIPVQEFFWYGCPHCNKLNPALQRWVNSHKKLAHVQFLAMPQNNGPWLEHAKLFYTYEALGVTSQVHELTFHLIHQEKKGLTTPEEAYDELTKHGKLNGIDKNRFVSTYNSQAVTDEVTKAQDLATSLKLEGVPVLVVDSRIVISTKGLRDETDVLKRLDKVLKAVKAGTL